ncbi:MAG: acylphosphatase [Euryarchaeota archaeon]|nr:acylphosphatase [Euryarchaeota archaeon]
MIRANIVIKGKVQMVGFRTFIKNIADSLNLKGFAENLPDGDLKIVCEGEKDIITEFIEYTRQKSPSFAAIEHINVEYETYKGEFTTFERRGVDVLSEDGEVLTVLKSFDAKAEKMVVLLGVMDGKLGSIDEKQDSMLEKQDRTIEILGGVKRDTSAMLEKQDDTIGEIRNVSGKIDQGKEEIVTEISSLRGDLKSYMENKFAKMEYEIAQIKTKIGLV